MGAEPDPVAPSLRWQSSIKITDSEAQMLLFKSQRCNLLCDFGQVT